MFVFFFSLTATVTPNPVKRKKNSAMRFHSATRRPLLQRRPISRPYFCYHLTPLEQIVHVAIMGLTEIYHRGEWLCDDVGHATRERQRTHGYGDGVEGVTGEWGCTVRRGDGRGKARHGRTRETLSCPPHDYQRGTLMATQYSSMRQGGRLPLPLPISRCGVLVASKIKGNKCYYGPD